MDKLYEYIRDVVVNFKLDTCFCVAPIKPGLLCIGYLNIFISLLFLVGTADESFNPPLISVQAVILEDQISKPLGIVAYGTEMVFNVLLLAGVYRNDVTLLRVYIYFVIGSIISSVLVYSIVFAAITLLLQIFIILILVFQCYVIVLVRSVIVEIKQARASEKNGHVTLYSVVRMPDDVPAKGEHPIEILNTEPKPAVEASIVEPKSVEHNIVEPKTTGDRSDDDPKTATEHSIVEPKTVVVRSIIKPKSTVEKQIIKKEHPVEKDIHSGQKKEESPSKLETINENVKVIKLKD